jgi:hypothetical protein
MKRESKYVYDTGFTFDVALASNIRDVYDRVKNQHKGGAIVIDGGIGEGKTTLAVQIADYINKLDGKPPIIIDKKTGFQIAMGGQQFIEKLQVTYKEGYPVIIYDEGGDFSRRGSLTQFNQTLNRIFETYRAFKIIVIICLPNFKNLDGSLLEKNIPRFMLHCQERNINRGSFKGYSLYRMFYIAHYMKKIVVSSFAYQIVGANFNGDFLNLEPEREKALDNLSTNSKLNEAEQAEIKMAGLISARDIARKLAKSLAWISLALRDLNIMPAKKIKKLAYYKEDITMEQLWSYTLREKIKPGRKVKDPPILK